MANISYDVSEDTYINARIGYQDDINGSGSEVKTRVVNGELTYPMFKVGAITEIEGKTVTSAILNLYVDLISASTWTNGIHVESIDSSWSESTATWNNKPTFGSIVETNMTTPSGTGWVTVEITNIVQNWADGNNYGVILFGEASYNPSTTGYVHFYPSENSTYKPYVEIEYSDDGGGGSGSIIYSNYVNINILYYDKNITATTGTTSTSLKLTDHGMSDDDFIVNGTRSSDLQNNPERGCRRVTRYDSNTVTISPAITGQVSGDNIMIYKKVDVSSFILLHSIKLSLEAEKNGSLEFDMIIPTSSSGAPMLPVTGQYVFVTNVSRIFTGVISQVTYKMYNQDTAILASISVVPLKNRAFNRTIYIDYAKGTTTTTIINAMIVFLANEGIEAGTINAGKPLNESWKADCISIGEVLDELASQNEFQWFVDENFKLHFIQDITVVDTENSLEDGGTFTDYRNVIVEDNIMDYCNKSYVVGGSDENGNCIIAIAGDYASQNLKRADCAGSGVYGEVSRNGSNTDNASYTATTGTTATNLVITAHPFSLGDYIYNSSKKLYGFVTAVVNSNTVTTTSIASQGSGDTIYYYSMANSISRNVIKRQSTLPIQIQFHSFNLTFMPQQRLYVNLAKLNINQKYFLIEKVEITDAGRQYFNCNVTAVMRNSSSFSTQRRRTMEVDFFKNF